MPTNRPLKVFLCHASADKPAVRKLYQYLRERKMDPWLDTEKLLPGQNWQVEIPKALLSSDVIIICLSKNSVDKEGYVQKEIKFALDKALEMPEGRIFLIPARLEECNLPLSLSNYQYVNLFEADGYRRLLRSLRVRAEQIGATKISVNQDTTPNDAEKAVREKAELDAAEKDAREKLERDAAEKAARELAEQQAADKLAQQKAEQDAAEKLAREKEEQENVEKAARLKAVRENAEKITRGKEEREAAQKKPVEKPVLPKNEPIATLHKQTEPKKSDNQSLPGWIGFLGLIFIIAVGFIVAINLQPSTPVPAVTATYTALSITAETYTASPPPTETLTPEPSLTPTPTLGIGSSMISPKDGMSLMYVPAGNFTMGSNDFSDAPVHPVTLDAFWIDRTDVTNAMYAKCMQDGECSQPSNTDHYNNPNYANHPVVYVSWNNAQTYCSWAGRQLPSEAQWEKAARGTDERIYPWGNQAPSKDLLNYNGIVGDTTAVGSYPNGASPYGALDMAGNVWQWVNDWYSDTYYQSSPSSNPVGPDSGQYRVLRGGSWNYYYGFVRSASRDWSDPSYSNYLFDGFRCARSLP